MKDRRQWAYCRDPAIYNMYVRIYGQTARIYNYLITLINACATIKVLNKANLQSVQTKIYTHTLGSITCAIPSTPSM